MFDNLKNTPMGARLGSAEVKAVRFITPHMVRVTLTGALIAEFSSDTASGYCKLLVPETGQSFEDFEAFVNAGDFKKELRTYTLRYVRPADRELDIDIVTHGDLGRVGTWAQRTQPGDVIVMSRPGALKFDLDHTVKRVLAAADMTSFPALAAKLEALSHSVEIEAYVETLSDEDRQPVDLPDGTSINWIVKSDPSAPSTALIAAMKSAAKPDANTAVFAAGEFALAGEMRQYFAKDLKHDKARTYISSYWKHGLVEPEHKIAKANAA